MTSADLEGQAAAYDRYRALLAVSEAIVSHRDLAALVGYSWPGNIRELQNVIERAVILSPGPALQVPLGDLQPPSFSPLPSGGEGSGVRGQTSVPTASAVTLADAEREHIRGVLRETGWVVAGPKGAAARLGMKRSTLYKKMTKLGISRPE